VAVVLTALVAVAWFAVPSLQGDDAAPANALPERVARMEVAARNAVQAGTDLRSLYLLGAVRSAIDVELAVIATERAALEQRAAGAPSPRQEIAASAASAAAALERAVIAYRDAVYTVRLANVASAEAGVNAALAQLSATVDDWNDATQ
jgi:hypothetical protein